MVEYCFWYSVGSVSYVFCDFKEVMVKVSLVWFGDLLVGVVVGSVEECVIVQMVLVNLLLKIFFDELLIFYEEDEVIWLIFDSYDCVVFVLIVYLIVGDFCNWLLVDDIDSIVLVVVVFGVMLEMVVVVFKIMCNQDLILVVKKCCVIMVFCNIIGLFGCLFICLQFNYFMDDVSGIVVSMFDGLMYGNGDVVIGINFVIDNVLQVVKLVGMMVDVIVCYEILM